MLQVPIRQKWKNWLLSDQPEEEDTPNPKKKSHHATNPWWQTMCLTGVDYFSTLGYQPGIAALAAIEASVVVSSAGLSPIATIVLVAVTLLGALPMYMRVTEESPHGQGSISMLEKLLPGWWGKIFVLVLLGFVATDFVITMTLSAADATAHLTENPYTHFLTGKIIATTLFLLTLLSAVFLKGFKEAIWLAVGLVTVYLGLNVAVLAVSTNVLIQHPEHLEHWHMTLLQNYGSPLGIAVAALVLFPKLALGLSGFETGVLVMSHVRGHHDDTEQNPVGRIRNTKKLLLSAAVLMSIALIFSSIVTSMLIPEKEFLAADPANNIEQGAANGRALAYLAHMYLGKTFGTIYDASTILILWFAGASAMAGLLNVIPQYLPKYGMAPEWLRASRPLVLLITLINFLVTVMFRASVDAQGGAYATGVLVLITSACFGVTKSAIRRGEKWTSVYFSLITIVFVYTTVVNIYERPDGIKIAIGFICFIIFASVVSRVWRSRELRISVVEYDKVAVDILNQVHNDNPDVISLISVHDNPLELSDMKIRDKYNRANRVHHVGKRTAPLVHITPSNVSEFKNEDGTLLIYGHRMGDACILSGNSTSIANALAAIALTLRGNIKPRVKGEIPAFDVVHLNMRWRTGKMIAVSHAILHALFGFGDTARETQDILTIESPGDMCSDSIVVHCAGTGRTPNGNGKHIAIVSQSMPNLMQLSASMADPNPHEEKKD